MGNTSELLLALDEQRQNLAANLSQKGVAASSNEGLQTLVPKVLDISGGGGGSVGDMSFNPIIPKDTTTNVYNFGWVEMTKKNNIPLEAMGIQGFNNFCNKCQVLSLGGGQDTPTAGLYQDKYIISPLLGTWGDQYVFVAHISYSTYVYESGFYRKSEYCMDTETGNLYTIVPRGSDDCIEDDALVPYRVFDLAALPRVYYKIFK